MKSDVVQAFVGSARDVLLQEMGDPVEPQKVRLQAGPYLSQEVTVIIGLARDMEGAIILGMSRQTALSYVSRVMGDDLYELDDLAQSGIGELCNVIAGRAGVVLGEKGYETVIAPPTVLIGADTRISTLSLQRLVVPVETPLGVVEIQLAAKENK